MSTSNPIATMLTAITSGKAKIKNILRIIINAIIVIYTKQLPVPYGASAIVIGISRAGAGTETGFFTFGLRVSIVYALGVIWQASCSIIKLPVLRRLLREVLHAVTEWRGNAVAGGERSTGSIRGAGISRLGKNDLTMGMSFSVDGPDAQCQYTTDGLMCLRTTPAIASISTEYEPRPGSMRLFLVMPWRLKPVTLFRPNLAPGSTISSKLCHKVTLDDGLSRSTRFPLSKRTAVVVFVLVPVMFVDQTKDSAG
ncbi:LOW QUALITY PROTEIN: hypothetical protein U9M48_042646 [Paspalum notatum var. saurae]|uniref:Uncharacterized protein n=1 Tax=Paspalum notatum var. saurae TaxID=547442 RepID=A0AAQ3UVL0_PASNO